MTNEFDLMGLYCEADVAERVVALTLADPPTETTHWTAAMMAKAAGISVSSVQGLVANSDGSVDIYFGPKAPKGKEANWAPTVKGTDYFLLFRFYGPTETFFDKSYKLNDVKTVN